MYTAGAMHRSGLAARPAWRQQYTASLLLVVSMLVCGTALGPRAGTVLAIVCILVLGVPHGALDAEIARPWLRPSFGRLWFGTFAIPYLFLAAAVLAAWRFVPSEILAVFLAASVCHFGLEDTGPRDSARSSASYLLEVVARGGLPVAVPTLLHPAATARFLGTVSLSDITEPPAWLLAASWAWCPMACCWAVAAIGRAQWPSLTDMLLIAALFVLLPPLTAFAVYFVCLHGPRHMAGVIREGAAPRVRNMQSAILQSLPVTALTFAIGTVLWPWFPGPSFADRLLTVTIQGLAALTLPHMLQEGVVARLQSAHQAS